MLTLFRKIRKQWLDTGATRKYILYAVGEIALVVIGILIALQINNWNEWRQDRVKEKVILQNVKENLEINIEILQSSFEVVDNLDRSASIVQSFFQGDIPYNDSLDRHFYLAVLMGVMQGNLTHDGYETFKNAGFELMRSESLKKKIVRLFEVNYGRLDEWRGNQRSLHQSFMTMRTNEFVQYEGGLKPQDIASISSNKDVQSSYNTISVLRNILTNYLKSAHDETNEVLQLVIKELEGFDQ